MCYDVAFTSAIRELKDYFPDLVFEEQIEINYDATVHIAGHSYGNHPIIYQNRDSNHIHCKLMEWGCIPFYIKDENSFVRQRANMLNARSERILGDPKSYWYKIRNRRCLIPVSGIYEHRAIKGWKKKVPYFIRPLGEKLFFLPGLYSVVELPNTETGELVKRPTFTIITREANELMAQIHNNGENAHRMPLFLKNNMALTWLKEDLSNDDISNILNYKIPSEELEYWSVYTIRSNKERPDSKAKNEPYIWENLPALGELNP